MTNLSDRSGSLIDPSLDSAGAAIARATAALIVPKALPATSFVLHAPLELMARVQLLPLVSPTQRDAAIDRIDRLADEYQAAGDSVSPPPVLEGEPAAEALLRALADGDQALVDVHATAWLARHGAPGVVGAVGEALVTSTAAAGHVPIGLAQLLCDPGMPTALLRGPPRAVAAAPERRVSWHEVVATEGDANGLYAALRAAPMLGRPGSDFIHPLMMQVQQPGVADRLLGPVLADRYDVPAALATVSRVAAWSMLHDDPEQAPYGWTHALTMPQAVLSLAGAGVRARTALAVAGTFALGFRAAHGTVPLPAHIARVIAPAGVGELASAASVHHDAHVVKFTAACIRAATYDTACAGLYLAAAAFLLDWWRDLS